MPNPWFRMYSEFMDDPKVQMMSESDQRRLVMLFCERCKEVKHTETLRAFHWRITPLELSATKAVFIEHGFIDDDWNVINWDERQFISDSSTERVRQFRERLKHKETVGNVTLGNVTAQEADTEADAEELKPYPSMPDGLSDVDSKEAKRLAKEAAKEAEKAVKLAARQAAREAKAIADAAAKAAVKKFREDQRLTQKRASPPTKTEFAQSRHADFKVAVFEYWKSKNPEIDCPWQQAEGMQLELWLRSSPTTTLVQFRNMLRNRYRSDVNHSERPSVWLKNITSFAMGPLDRFGKPLATGGKTNGRSADRAFDTAASLIEEIENYHGTHSGQLLQGG